MCRQCSGDEHDDDARTPSIKSVADTAYPDCHAASPGKAGVGLPGELGDRRYRPRFACSVKLRVFCEKFLPIARRALDTVLLAS